MRSISPFSISSSWSNKRRTSWASPKSAKSTSGRGLSTRIKLHVQHHDWGRHQNRLTIADLKPSNLAIIRGLKKPNQGLPSLGEF